MYYEQIVLYLQDKAKITGSMNQCLLSYTMYPATRVFYLPGFELKIRKKKKTLLS